MVAVNKTTCDNGSVLAAGEHHEFKDDTLTLGGAGTILAGTILARRKVAAAITPSAVTGTGNGTVTAASVQAGTQVPKAGNWTLRCTVAATNGGTFRLEDPDGEVIVGGLVLTAGSGGANAFKAGGLAFTINDGSTDFAVGDTFTLPVTAVNKLEVFVSAGVGGVQYPTTVLTYPVTVTGAGDVRIRSLTKGPVRKERLVIDADGNDTNVTDAVIEQLRNFGITPVNAQQLAVLDP